VQTGTKISIAGHGLLLGWAALGGWFQSEPQPFAVQEVSLISAEEFARLSQQRQAPVVAPDATVLAPPEESAAPEVSVPPAPRPEPDVAPERPEPLPEPTPEPIVEDVPEVEPDPIVRDTPPEVEAPETAVVLPPQPEAPQLTPVDRVAPVPVAPPEPDVAVDDVVQPEVAPEDGADDTQEVQEATAPEAANDRIVTEENRAEEQVVAAPTRSVRPKSRPQRAVAEAPEETAPQSDTAVERSAVEDALAAALAGGADVEAPEPTGPPLTSGEKDALRVAVSQCWNVGSLSSDALRTTVVVGVSLAQDGKPDVGSIRMLSSTGGSAAAAKQAYEAARRAIIRCGSRGFQLPPDKYAHWRDIEMTFNPERMRIK